MNTKKTTDGKEDDEEKMAYKLPEAAAALRVSPITVRRLVARGLLKPNRALRHLIFARSELLRFLEEN